MPRGRAWTQAEVGSLLALVGGSGEAALLMASTSRPNEALWQQISRGLAAAGYSRSVAQCRSKWKALKQAFHSERETRRRAGLHSPRLPPHYRAMKSIWKAAGRPVFRERRLLGSGVAGLLQSVQQLLVQILQTSRQQQALLESLASDTVSHLHLLSHSLVQQCGELQIVPSTSCNSIAPGPGDALQLLGCWRVATTLWTFILAC
ncbi:hypothetical protein ASZ78_012232 [Callipepla squamata]|uniref:Myb-like domain-containing protein n=1 Tax=Callipepla squamata TaxID=9009 RepID=A0A226MF09_CALSU|nr:hypothetical protein ASZ78_012232 [Callipepla squamata]